MVTIEQEVPSFVHSDDHPFCNDPDCPCHCPEGYEEHLEPFLNDGTMTGREALQIYWDM